MITEMYAIPKYKEVNPSLFACITFPFLFSVMFGDIAHGLVVLTLSTVVVFAEPRVRPTLPKDSLLHMVFDLRYLFLLMGLFTVYCGFIYNDFASIPLWIYSCYVYTEGKAEPSHLPDCVHMPGLDPAWYVSTNEITYQNSFKMKVAVIIGVCHMSMGIVMKAFNSVYFGSKVDFFFEFIP